MTAPAARRNTVFRRALKSDLLPGIVGLGVHIAITSIILVIDGRQPRHWVYVVGSVCTAALAWTLRGNVESIRQRKMVRTEVEALFGRLEIVLVKKATEKPTLPD